MLIALINHDQSILCKLVQPAIPCRASWVSLHGNPAQEPWFPPENKISHIDPHALGLWPVLIDVLLCARAQSCGGAGDVLLRAIAQGIGAQRCGGTTQRCAQAIIVTNTARRCGGAARDHEVAIRP